MLGAAASAATFASNIGALPTGKDLKKATNTVSLIGGAGMSGFILGGLLNAGKEAVGVSWQSAAATGVLWDMWYFTKE